MTEKRDPTKRSEERSGSEANDGPPDLPKGVEHGEYVNYRPESGEGEADAAAERASKLQPGEEKPGQQADTGSP